MFLYFASYQYNTVVSNPCPGGGGGGFYVVPNLYVINVCFLALKKNFWLDNTGVTFKIYCTVRFVLSSTTKVLENLAFPVYCVCRESTTLIDQ